MNRSSALLAPAQTRAAPRNAARKMRRQTEVNITSLAGVSAPFCDSRATLGLGRLGGEGSADVVNQLLDQLAIVALAHDANDRLRAGGADDQPPALTEPPLRVLDHMHDAFARGYRLGAVRNAHVL